MSIIDEIRRAFKMSEEERLVHNASLLKDELHEIHHETLNGSDDLVAA